MLIKNDINRIVVARLDPSGWNLSVGNWFVEGDFSNGDTIAEFQQDFEKFIDKVKTAYPSKFPIGDYDITLHDGHILTV